MKNTLFIILMIIMTSCSNSGPDKSDSNQTETDSRAQNPNMIRNQTETNFRSLNPQSDSGYKTMKPLTGSEDREIKNANSEKDN